MGLSVFPAASSGSYPIGSEAGRPSAPAEGTLYFNATRGELQIYTSSGWWSIDSKPQIPTSPATTNTLNTAFGSAPSASIAFTRAASGGLPETYTVTSTPGSLTGTGSSSPVTVSGLNAGTAYTYTVSAANNYGSSTSAATTTATAGTVPQAPTIGAASFGDASANIEFTTNGTGGRDITVYTATSTPGNFTGTSTSTPITVTGLSNGTAYTFKVTATNAIGTSLESASSNSTTPSATPLFETLMLAGGGSGGTGIGGGGGAGGLIYQTAALITGNLYTCTVGGGAPVPTGGTGAHGAKGTNSNITGTGISLTAAAGGGGGGSYGDGAAHTSRDGGSGGGGHFNSQPGGSASPAGQGNNGSAGGNGAYYAGGGGGAGAAGSVSNGGSGSNAYSVWASATSSGVSGYFAGGGSGNRYDNASNGGSTGGVGGGGGSAGNTSGTSGTANTGGGGAGGGWVNLAGGGGGSGIILIRYSSSYRNATTVTGAANSNSPYTSGGYKYYKFTGTGAFTF
jgi:hypothetical protein